MKHLDQRKYDLLAKDQNEDTPLHAIVRSDRRDKLELMIGLLVHSDFGCEEIDFPALYGNTALHIAVKVLHPFIFSTHTLSSMYSFSSSPFSLLPLLPCLIYSFHFLSSFFHLTLFYIPRKEIYLQPKHYWLLVQISMH